MSSKNELLDDITDAVLRLFGSPGSPFDILFRPSIKGAIAHELIEAQKDELGIMCHTQGERYVSKSGLRREEIMNNIEDMDEIIVDGKTATPVSVKVRACELAHEMVERERGCLVTVLTAIGGEKILLVALDSSDERYLSLCYWMKKECEGK